MRLAQLCQIDSFFCIPRPVTFVLLLLWTLQPWVGLGLFNSFTPLLSIVTFVTNLILIITYLRTLSCES
jgi:hypothetical protein